jgi:hypothetical protein
MDVAHLFADDICEHGIVAHRRATAIRIMLHNESMWMVLGTVSVMSGA